jgi:hypothetical protein
LVALRCGKYSLSLLPGTVSFGIGARSRGQHDKGQQEDATSIF